MSTKRVTGHAAFAGDLLVPGLLHVRVVRSPHAHARLLAIDASAARALPGVSAVLTHEDVIGRALAPGARLPLDATLRFVGDRVAVVAAEDADLAQHAADAVRAQYEERPPVLDPEQALLPGAPAVHTLSPGQPANLAARFMASLGDVDRAFSEAERVFDATYQVPAAVAAPLEPHVAITWLDEDRRLVVRTSTESPFQVRETLAARLGIPAARIRVVPTQVGGGFGGKADVVAEDLCALVTLRTGRPARLAFSREEELTVAPAGPAQTVHLRIAVRDRRMTALDLSLLADAGAYPAKSEWQLRAAARAALAVYGVPALRFLGQAAYTHRPPTGPLRGQAALPALFALESQLDEIATALDEDPVELRRRHLASAEEAARVAAALGDPAPTGHFDGAEAMAAAADEIGWSRRWKAAAHAGPRRRGVGMALVRQPVVGERGAASLRIREDGSFNLFVGASALGSDAETAFAAAAADALGVPPERVVPASGDTDSAPFDPGATAPTLHLTGQAVLKAAAVVQEQLRLAEGALPTSVSASVSVSVFEAAEDAPSAGGACFAEVEVDVETGETRVLTLVSALAGGRLLDPRLAEAQAEGDALRAAGDALVARMAFSAEGRSLFRSLRDYPLASAVDAPEVRTLFVPADAPPTPFGTTPQGEVMAIAPALAIANAVAHAIGARLRALPLTPEHVRTAVSRTDP